MTQAAVLPSIASAFLPVRDPSGAAAWYAEHLGFAVREQSSHAAVLDAANGQALTLLGPASGIRAAPGLEWASFSVLVDDLDGARAVLAGAGAEPTSVQGDPETCLFVVARDPDGNTLLVVDR